LTDISEILIALMMEAVRTSETSVNFYQTTRRNIPEENHLQIRHRENLKSRLEPTVLRNSTPKEFPFLHIFRKSTDL
jgi:hypothetical protein